MLLSGISGHGATGLVSQWGSTLSECALSHKSLTFDVARVQHNNKQTKDTFSKGFIGSPITDTVLLE